MVEKMKNQELITNKKPLDLQIKNGIKYFPVFVVLCVFAFLLLAPLVWMCLGSFKSDTEVMQYPPKFFPQANHLLENWKTVMTRIDFLTLTKNTVIYAVGCTIPSMFINALAGYAFARFNFKGKNLLFLLFLATMMIPFQVIMVPLYLEVYYLKWLNTYWGLIIPKVASAYWIFLCRAAFQELPKELEDAARRQEDFIGSFAHELKTPLTSMIGYADMLRSRKLDEEKHFLCANYIYTEGKRLETMALRLLDIIVTRRKEIDRKTTNVSGIFSYLQEIYDETKNPGDSRVKVDICWEKGELYAEENLLKTVLINLTDNAIKASEEGQTVEITGRRMENGYYFQVRDEGIGIPEEELQKITEAFYMVDKSRSRAHNGARLGLALCTAILELHHSSLKIESTQGFGSCMSFLIPDEGVKSDE